MERLARVRRNLEEGGQIAKTAASVMACAAITAASMAQAPASGGLTVEVRTGPMATSGVSSGCITDDERARVARAVRAWQANASSRSASSSLLASQLYTFFPMGGRLYRDVFTYNFVDLDPGAGLLEFDCGVRTEDGHLGNDTLIRSFQEQLIGVPVFSALDGVVAATSDGNPDMNTVCSTSPSNYVVVDHGGGRLTHYWHLASGSVSVATGQAVRAGQQIGLVGSSGCSYWPHLHFEEQLGGAVIEPYAGPCNPGPSGWAQQTPIEYALYMDDFGVSDTLPGTIGTPNYVARSGQWPQTSDWLYVWSYLKNFPANSDWRMVFVRPNGTTAYDSGTTPFGNAHGGRWRWAYWGYFHPVMQSVAGTWTVRLWLNGVHQIDAQVVVVPALVPGFNRPPEPISVAFSPPYPTPSDVVACEVETSLIADDLDWDVVRYRYVWRVDGAVVRDVTSAAHSDFLARDSWSLGSVLSCDVTPNDGTVDGPTAGATTFIARSYCTAGVTSSGCTPTLQTSGVPSGSAGAGFTIDAMSVEGQRQGLFFYGLDNSGFTPLPWGTSSSFFCVKPPTQRTAPADSGGSASACDGALSIDWNAFVATNPGALGAPFAFGSHVYAQAWFRDPPGPKTTAFTDAVEFLVGP